MLRSAWCVTVGVGCRMLGVGVQRSGAGQAGRVCPASPEGHARHNSALPSHAAAPSHGLHLALVTVRWLALRAWCLALGAWRVRLGAWCLRLSAWRLVPGAWRLVPGAWGLVLGA